MDVLSLTSYSPISKRAPGRFRAAASSPPAKDIRAKAPDPMWGGERHGTLAAGAAVRAHPAPEGVRERQALLRIRSPCPAGYGATRADRCEGGRTDGNDSVEPGWATDFIG